MLVRLAPCVAYSPHEPTTSTQSLQAPSVSCGDYYPWRLAVLPLLPELPGHRRVDGGTWGHADLRSRALLVSEVWGGVCPSAPAPAPSARRHVAPGRGVAHHSWRTPLSLAHGGSGGQHP